jgi:hypothetical protein
MNALRLSGAALVATVLLAAAAALGLNACGPEGTSAWLCNVPIRDELGADGGPDPCHCNPPGGMGCPCTTPGDGQDGYFLCMHALEDDAGAGEGGP